MSAFQRLSMLFVVLCSVLLHANGLPISYSNNGLARYDSSAINRSEGGPLPARQDDISSRPAALKRAEPEKRPLPPVPAPQPPPSPPPPTSQTPKTQRRPLPALPPGAIPSDGFASDANPSDKVVKLLLLSNQLAFTQTTLAGLSKEVLNQKFAMAQLLADFGDSYVTQFGLTAQIRKVRTQVKLLLEAFKALPKTSSVSASA